MNIVRCNVCGYVGEPKTKGSFLVTIILLCFGVFPGIIYEIWRRSGGKVCGSCGSHQITGTGMMKNNQPSKRNNKNTLLILAGVFVFMLIFVKIFSPVHNEETVSTDSSKIEEKPEPIDQRKPEIENVEHKEAIHVSSSSQPASFEECKLNAQSVMSSVGSNYKTAVIVDTSLAYIVRICTNDGSVLVTCSSEDKKMVTTQSSDCPL